MFKTLTVEAEDNGSSEEEEAQTPSAPRKISRKPGRGKKTKKGKKGKKQKKVNRPITDDLESEEAPLESIEIIEDADGGITNYLMAVYSAVIEWIDLRRYIQGLWKEVAYDGLDGAVAGAVSNMSISMIKQTSSAIFVGFPGHDSYKTIMKTITRGDPGKAQGNFILARHAFDPQGRPSGKA